MGRLKVICLCAEWCGVCGEWREIFSAEAALHPQLEFLWVDVEDEADAMGDVDIETFPTLLVSNGDVPVFFGPVQPVASQLSRLVASLCESEPSDTVSAEAGPLLNRLSLSVLAKR